MDVVVSKVSKNKTRTLTRKMRGGGVPHVNSRSTKNPAYSNKRFDVPDDKADWKVVWPEYNPIEFTAASVLANERGKPTGAGWADPIDLAEISEELEDRITYHPDGTQKTLKEADLIVDGIPRYPIGRTGTKGRGMLGKWGPNHAADPIVTRVHPEEGLQIVAIQRNDNMQWALPGGMVDPGEDASATVKREFTEEAGHITDPAKKDRFNQLVEELFKNGEQIYRGCVDDPRNTDNAWMETTAFHFPCSAELGAMLPLNAGSDAREVKWLNVSDDEPLYVNLYASHRSWVEEVKKKLIEVGVIPRPRLDALKATAALDELQPKAAYADDPLLEMENMEMKKIGEIMPREIMPRRYAPPGRNSMFKKTRAAARAGVERTRAAARAGVERAGAKMLNFFSRRATSGGGKKRKSKKVRKRPTKKVRKPTKKRKHTKKRRPRKSSYTR